MKITAQQIETIRRRLLFAFGSVRVSQKVDDMTIISARLTEIEECLSDIDEVIDVIDPPKG